MNSSRERERSDGGRAREAAEEEAESPNLLVQRFGARGARRAIQRRVERRDAASLAGDGEVQAAAERGTSGPSEKLPHLEQIQRSFGRHDVSHVRAHTGAQAAEGAAAMGARAFASDDRVAFSGAVDLHTAAHEAAHVVQQRRGVHLKGGVGQEGDRYEQHADRVADKVVAGESSEGLLDEVAGGGGAAGGVQRTVAKNLLGYYTTDDETLIFHTMIGAKAYERELRMEALTPEQTAARTSDPGTPAAHVVPRAPAKRTGLTPMQAMKLKAQALGLEGKTDSSDGKTDAGSTAAAVSHSTPAHAMGFGGGMMGFGGGSMGGGMSMAMPPMMSPMMSKSMGHSAHDWSALDASTADDDHKSEHADHVESSGMDLKPPSKPTPATEAKSGTSGSGSAGGAVNDTMPTPIVEKRAISSGTFDVTINGSAVVVADGGALKRGAFIALKFQSRSPRARVAFIQTVVRKHDEVAVNVHPNRATPDGRFVDRVQGKAEPHYGLKDDGGDTLTGQKGSGGKEAVVVDSPNTLWRPGLAVDWTATTFAHDMDSGEFLGSMQWGYQLAAADGRITLKPIAVTDAGRPAASHLAAIEGWNKQAAGAEGQRSHKDQKPIKVA